ncbi:MAG TPA: TonB-dependent receptor plug domain-containing protein, partial [Saprospiraceae bacterium]|nr:TonB-dependent receptor plug domain-containing protein [Saprospiraceae bacterium]
MKKTITILLFWAMALPMIAQGTLQGKVTDEKGEPLIGVAVYERGTDFGTSTDLDGKYSLTHSGPNAVITFSMLGFVTQEIKAGNQKTLDVKLLPDVSLLDQVVVLGSRRSNRAQTETMAPVDVINIRQASMSTARFDVTSMMNYSAPSFNYNKQSGSDGGDHVDLATLRGLGPDQTLVLVNGKRRHQTAFVAVFGTRGRGNSGTDLNAIPAASVERIEVLRDGASAQYGSDAIAGVVNIILRRDTGFLNADLGFSVYHDPKYNPAYKHDLGLYVHGNKLDGAAYTANVNYGLPLGKKGGFVNVGLQYADLAKTFRQELDGVLPESIYRRAHGDGSMRGLGGMFNLEAPVKENDRMTFYAFGGYNSKNSDAYAFTRNFSARPERFPTKSDGEIIPVSGIIFTDSGGEQYY